MKYNYDSLRDSVDYSGNIDVESLKGYLGRKAVNHTYYKIYSKRKYIDGWVRDNSLYLGDGYGWNDVLDSERFMDTKDTKRFGLCMSFSKSENVAMWMLYGGNARDGAILNLKGEDINTIMNTTGRVSVGYWKDETFIHIGEIKQREGNEENYEIFITDIVYCGNTIDKNKKGETGYRVQRSSEYVLINSVEALYENIGYCVKSFPWNYENEVRLVIEVKKDALYSLAKKNGLKGLTLRIDTQGMFLRGDGRLIYAPIGGVTHLPEGYSASRLKGELDWNLCKNCDKLKREEKPTINLK